MRIKHVLTVLLAAAALHSMTVAAQDLFRLSFKATAKGLGNNGKIVTTRITDRTIIQEALGTTTSSVLRSNALAYNAASDSIQVVDTNGNSLADVIQFQGGQFVTDGNTSVRLTFMFVPDQTDSIGTAILTERAPSSVSGTASDRASISATMQFALNGDSVLGGATNGVLSSTGNTVPTAGTTTNTALSSLDTNTVDTTTTTNGATTTTGSDLFDNGTTTTDVTTNSDLTSTNNIVVGSSSGTSTNSVTTNNASGFFYTDETFGGTNAFTNVRIYTGTFTSSRRIVVNGGTAGTTGTTNATTGTTGTGT